MTTYVKYITQERDRWDLIAYRMYSDPYDYERIIIANPMVPIVPLLPAGLHIAVPVIERMSTQVLDLPPWKR